MDRLSLFLGETLSHLSNRASARERSRFHLMEAYRIDTSSVGAGFPLRDLEEVSCGGFRAVPPAEHMVAVAWGYSKDQIAWTEANQIAAVPLGPTTGMRRVHAHMSAVQHLMLRGEVAASSSGLWRLTQPGYRLMSSTDLKAVGYPAPNLGDMYAVFDVASQPDWRDISWSSKSVLRAIRAFDAASAGRWGVNGRDGPRLVRIVSLFELLVLLPNHT